MNEEPRFYDLSEMWTVWCRIKGHNFITQSNMAFPTKALAIKCACHPANDPIAVIPFTQTSFYEGEGLDEV